jgi:hypothetical protein
MAGARGIVDGPGFVALPNALWDVAQHPEPGGPHWQQGVTWEEWCGGGGTAMDECIAVTGTGGAPAPQKSLTGTVTQQNRGATAFTVYAEFDCSLVGQDAERNQAEDALLRTEAYQVTRAFWTGTAGATAGGPATTVWPHLAASSVLDDPQGIRLQTAASPLVTGGDDSAVVLGALEAQLAACYGGEGVIHIPYAALPTFAARTLVRPGDDGRLRTTAGNLVVAGQGYTGSGPDGSAPAAGTSWIYATGALFGYRSDVFTREFPGTFDRAENTVKKLASRTYLLGFECCHLAALLNLGVPT